MLYALVNAGKAMSYGLKKEHHRFSKKGEMVVNENELLKVDQDIHKAAQLLGGKVMKEYEIFNALNL